MRKQLLKLTLIVAVLFSVSATYAQGIFWTEEGTYKIGARGTNLFMTIDPGTGNVLWQTELPGDDPLQVWTIVNHRTPASAGLMEITAFAFGMDFTMTTADQLETDHPNYKLSVKSGTPLEVAYTPGNGVDDPIYSGDRTGFDQFQRRKAKVDANGDPDPNGENPPGIQNNALFIQTPWGTNSRYGVIPGAAGEQVTFDAGGIDVIDFHLVQSLSTEAFDASSIVITNPVNNRLSVKGLTSKISQLAVYSLLGQEVMSRQLNGESSLDIDVSALTSGMYIVNFKGENGSLTKKILKQ